MSESKLERFKSLLAELFMFDNADLDFGIYRIMNAKRDEITKFLDMDLLPQVRETLSQLHSSDRSGIERQLAEAIKQATELGINPSSSPKVKELQTQLTASVDVTAIENEVFSHLYNFFRRYYKEGDFLSLPRYKEGVYAIPYEGEEVKLHWANNDQYYIKSAEYFRDYTFKLDDGRRVHLKLASADTEQDNKKSVAGQERKFILCENDTITDKNGELYIAFEYKEPEGKQAQKTLNEEALQKIMSLLPTGWKAGLAELKPTKSNVQRSILQKHLEDYTARNSFDYFIHKNLSKFLRRELDFYIKNEVMHLDDIDAEEAPKVEQYLAKMKAIRRIANKIIEFLAQLENFQKKLWLKKKFVIETNYFISLDHIPENLYPEITKNLVQRDEWIKLYAIDEIQSDFGRVGYSETLTVEFLKAYPMLMIDTKYFSSDFLVKVLRGLNNIYEITNGVIIKSENFQALSFLQKSNRKKVNCIYTDPPYNADSSEIIYKNTYKHSSWLSLIENRVVYSKELLSDKSVFVVAIDDVEQEVLGQLLTQIFPDYTKTCVTIVHNATGQQGTNFSYTHEYSYFLFPKNGKYIGLQNREENPDVRPLRNVSKGSHLRTDAANCFYPIFLKNGDIVGFGDVCSDDFHPSGINVKKADGIIEVYPIDPQGVERKWVFARDTVESILSELKAEYDEKKKTWDIIRTKEKFNYKTVWWDSKYSANSYGSRILNEMIPNNPFTFPKSIYTVRDCIDAGLNNRKTGLVLDYFAGSGTTGHAIINLNREDGGNRKFILIEMGDHCETVLIPRIKKIAFAPEWQEGKPKRLPTLLEIERGPKIIKTIKLESYEDALNNIKFNKNESQIELIERHSLLREDYYLRYALNVESEDSNSLLNIHRIEDPFNYTMQISTGSAGETKEQNIDLVETFNYLIGLHVKHIDVIKGFRIIEGVNPQGEKVLIIWRNTKEKTNEVLDEFFQKQGYNTRDKEYGVVYVNGDNNLENLRRDDETWKVRLIEEEFHRLMFEDVEGL